MSSSLHGVSARLAMILSPLIPIAAAPTTSHANASPESILLVDVELAGPSCRPFLDHCTEVQRSVDTVGRLEFTIYLMRTDWWFGTDLYIRHIEAEMTWPASWHLEDYEIYGAWGGIVTDGSVHTLVGEDWSIPVGDQPNRLVPVACLTIDVPEPGRLDFVEHWANPLELDGPDGPFTSFAAAACAEVAMTCEYTRLMCSSDRYCIARFDPETLALSAPVNGTADATVGISAQPVAGDPCAFDVDTRAEWCTAVYKPGGSLLVTASALGLVPGTYETEIQLASGSWLATARCLPVVFTVTDEPTPTRATSWSVVKARFR